MSRKKLKSEDYSPYALAMKDWRLCSDWAGLILSGEKGRHNQSVTYRKPNKTKKRWRTLKRQADAARHEQQQRRLQNVALVNAKEKLLTAVENGAAFSDLDKLSLDPTYRRALTALQSAMCFSLPNHMRALETRTEYPFLHECERVVSHFNQTI